MFVLVDLTRAFKGTEDSVLRAFMLDQRFEGADVVECLLLSSQVQPQSDFNVTFTRMPAEAATEESAIAATIYNKINEALQGHHRVLVASFRAAVRSIVETHGLINPGRVDFFHLAAFSVPGSGKKDEWDPSFMPLSEAVEILVGALSVARVPVRMTSIRGLLEARDSRFRKIPGTASARPGLISSIVEEAARENLVKLIHAHAQDNNPVIQLAPAGEARGSISAGSMPMPTYAGGSPVPQVSDATRQSVASSVGRSMSDIYIDTLRQANFGPFQEVRWAVYEEIDNLLGNGPKTFYALIRDAVANVRKAREAEPVRTNKPFPWSKVRAFIGTLVNRVPVFLHEGTPVQYSWDQVNVEVDAAAEDWRISLDGELVCFLLQNGCSITFNDMPSLAGALYNSRRDELQDRAISVIMHLLHTGKVVVDSNDGTQISLPGDSK